MNSWLEGICGGVLILGSAGALIGCGAAALLGGFLIFGAIRG